MKYAFGLKTASDWLGKARREVKRLEHAEMSLSSDENDVRDAGINAAITLWHLTDWLAKSNEPAVDAMRQSEFPVAKDDRKRLEAFQVKIRENSDSNCVIASRPEASILRSTAASGKALRRWRKRASPHWGSIKSQVALSGLR